VFALGRRDEALVCQREAGDLLRALTTRDPSNATWRHSLATLCDRAAGLSAEPAEARRWRELAVEQAGWLRERDPEDLDVLGLYAYAVSRLGLQVGSLDLPLALDCYARANRASREVLARTTRNYEAAVLFGWCAMEVVGLLRTAESGEESGEERRRVLGEAVEAMERVLSQVPDEPSLILNLLLVRAHEVEEEAGRRDPSAERLRSGYARMLALERHWRETLLRGPEALEDGMGRARAALAKAGVPPPEPVDGR
jgi:hypothetical protein